MNLQDTPFRSLLPASVRDDAKFAAAAQVLDAMLAQTDEQMLNAIIWARIDEIEDEALLANLAWQLHLDGYEGYALAASIDEKRNLVKNAIQLHFYKGTRWSLERIFELLSMRGRIVEWWEVPEDPDFHPYEFDIEFLETGRPITPELYGDLDKLVDALKNVRSHRRHLKVYWTTNGSFYVGAWAQYGANLTVWPFLPHDIELQSAVPQMRGAVHSIQKIEIGPFEEN